MAGMNRTVAFMFAILVAALLIGPVASTVASNVGQQTVTNESVTASTSKYVDLDGYNVVASSETVYWKNTSSGSYETVSSPGDYSMKYDPGSIKANSSGKVSDGDALLVSYDYNSTSGTTSTILNYVTVLIAVVILGAIGMYIQSEM